MININLFRDNDIKIIKENIDEIIFKATKKKIETIDPLKSDFVKIQDLILNFIKAKKRIIYGGTAWDILLKKKKFNNGIYNENDMPDIDFYSNEPLKDLKELCDKLAESNFQYIQGKNAQHDESYKIFVNFHEYCNITYMPSNIFFSINYELVNNFKLIHPNVVIIDLLRQFNDPINSMWRIEKTFKRGMLLLKDYPLNVSDKVSEFKKLPDNDNNLFTANNICKLIFDYCIKEKHKKIIWIDNNVINVYLNPSLNIQDTKMSYNNYALEFISQNLENDTKDIYFYLQSIWADNNNIDKFANEIKISEYYPFFQFLDRKIEIYFNNILILTIYKNYDYCIPFNSIDVYINDIDVSNLSKKKKTLYNKKIMIGTFNVLIMYLLMKKLYFYVNKELTQQYNINYALYKLINTKNNFLDKNKLSILDGNIFEDFKSECFGYTYNPTIKFMVSSAEGRKNRSKIPKSRIYPYDPNEHKDSFNFESYHFDNTSGNLINNPKDLIINLDVYNQLKTNITNE